MTTERFGATEQEWAHFDLVLGLGPDLLPVVSNPAAVISPQSKMKALGKTPSRYNKSRQVAGILDWTSHVSTPAEIAKWSTENDYGICVQTRSVRAIDVDIDDPKESGDVFIEIVRAVGGLPCRRRENGVKFLVVFDLPGEMPKRVLRTSKGIIEFLGTGQQFIAVGTHPSGSKYYWGGGIPTEIPTLSRDQFESLWSQLEAKFAVEPSTTASVPSKAIKLAEAAQNDLVAVHLSNTGLVKSTERDGRLHIICPFEAEHTADSADSATTYFPAFTGGFERGHFACLHAHCESRTDRDFLTALGIAPDLAADFQPIEEEVPAKPDNSAYYEIVRAHDFADGPPLSWVVKGIIPQAELSVVFGPFSSGKSFWVLDLVATVACGIPWCGRKVKKGPVCYVAAEGAAGFRNRLKALIAHHDLSREELDLRVLAAAPNLLQSKDVVKLGNSVNRLGRFMLLVVDTLAQTMTGGDENAAQDMGIVITNCKLLNQVTGATILLIHHTVKDTTKGMRGSSAMPGAIEAGIEISREDNNRTATIRKMKDGADGAQFGFVLKEVQIGMDEDGDVISSCVVEHGAVVAPKVKEKKATDNMNRIWMATLDLQSIGGATVSEDAVIAAARTAALKANVNPKNLDRDLSRAIDTWCLMRKLQRVAPGNLTILEAGL